MLIQPVIIGLCGGIASGKSTVARVFREWGGVLIDADKIGHRLLNNPVVREKLIKLYKKRPILAKDRCLISRRRLGEIVFARKEDLKRLNKLIHPLIVKEIRAQIKKARLNNKRLVVLDAALLMETGLSRCCDYLVFVNTTLKKRIYRATSSRNWSPNELKRREAFQLPLQYKKQKADFIINNNFSLTNTRQQARKILQQISSQGSNY